MSKDANLTFPFDRKPRPGGGFYHYRTCVCSQCGSRGYWQDNTSNGAAADMIAAGFRAKNWEMDSKGRGTCPACLGAKGPYQRMTKSQKRAAYLRIKASETAGETITVVQPTPDPAPVQHTEEPTVAQVEQPPQPSRADRRRIQDELELVYNLDLQRYKANWTDEALASKLDVPRAWVSEERDRAYGPAGNDAEIERLAAIQTLINRTATAVEAAMKAAEQAMAAADVAEKLSAELKAALGVAA